MLYRVVRLSKENRQSILCVLEICVFLPFEINVKKNMKNRRFWIILLACACVMFSACQNNKKKNTPEAVTEAFVKAFYTADFTNMYEYSTKQSQIVIKSLQNSMKEQPSRLEEMKKREIAFVDTKISLQTDSTAMCDCSFTVDGQSRDSQWELMKENDKWKVTLVLP